jgi:hypothetical protein
MPPEETDVAADMHCSAAFMYDYHSDVALFSSFVGSSRSCREKFGVA